MLSDEQEAAMVERLGEADLLGGVVEIGGLVDGDDRIADADAERRRAARISGLDHRAAAGGEDAVALPHQLVGLLERRRVDRDDEIGRRAHLDQRLAHLVADELVGELGARVRRDDDRVAALDRVDRLDDRRRLGVGRGRQRADHADRLGELDDVRARDSSSITPTDLSSMMSISAARVLRKILRYLPS